MKLALNVLMKKKNINVQNVNTKIIFCRIQELGDVLIMSLIVMKDMVFYIFLYSF